MGYRYVQSLFETTVCFSIHHTHIHAHTHTYNFIFQVLWNEIPNKILMGSKQGWDNMNMSALCNHEAYSSSVGR